MITIELDDVEVITALERLQQAIANPQPALEEIGEVLVASTKRRFVDKTGPDGSPWPANAPTTEAAKGTNNPLIGESKRLGREINYRARDNLLEIGSPLEYAATQHFGAARGAFGQTIKGAPIPWGNIPARPFLGVSDEDRQSIVEIVQAYLAQPTPTSLNTLPLSQRYWLQ